jgi:hypothetical protein
MACFGIDFGKCGVPVDLGDLVDLVRGYVA